MFKFKKMYSAFISSVYDSLKDERAEAIDALLDYRVFPICMEHFTTSTNEKFKALEVLINASDFFILILGRYYGSCDSDGISVTQKEYEYASEKGKEILAIETEELTEVINLSDEEIRKLPEDDKKQLKFAKSVPYRKKQSKVLPISKIIGQFFTGFNREECIGWVRATDHKNEEFRESCDKLNLIGRWYNFHMSDIDNKYIRIGYFDIEQNTTENNSSNLVFNGFNYAIKYNEETGEIVENHLKYTTWVGEYKLTLGNNLAKIQGIFEAKRVHRGEFNNTTIESGVRRGIHDFKIDMSEEEPKSFQGQFYDIAPSNKFGEIMAFRKIEDRDKYLRENLMETLLNN